MLKIIVVRPKLGHEHCRILWWNLDGRWIDELYVHKLFSDGIFCKRMVINQPLLGVPMRTVNNRPPTANRYNRQPPNRLTAITA
jgi:hypothetical protein